MSAVDVIVPCYRYAHFLRQCVESVLTQAGVDVRVLVIDDHSPDHTREVAASLVAMDARVSFRRHDCNQGHIATYNEGLYWASAESLLLLSADDYLLPGALARASRLLERHPDVGMVFGNAIESDEHGRANPLRPFGRSPGPGIITGRAFVEFSGARNIVPTPTAIVRTRLQKSLGGYRPELPHSGDMEMWLRFAAHASVGFVDDYQAVFRRHADNMSRAYALSHSMPDAEQRRAALDCFFANEAVRRWTAPALRGRIYGALARDVVGLASGAFNDGEPAVCEQLLMLAANVDPQVKSSWTWRKVAIKRLVGHRAWKRVEYALGDLWRMGRNYGPETGRVD